MKKTLVLKKTAMVALVSAVIGGTAVAGPFDSAMNVEKRINTAAASSQVKINNFADQTTDMALDYRTTLQRVDSLRVYNEQIRRLINAQNVSIAEFSSRMDSIDETEKGVLPLMDDMIKALDQFVKLDMPFNIEERTARVENLKKLMDDAEVSVSEKYRKILEAYQIEMGYGNVMQSTTGNINDNGAPLAVDFLRVGRTAYIYLAINGQSGKYYSNEINDWVALPEEYLEEVSEAIKMAKGISPTDLFKVPVPVAEAAQ